MAEKEMIDRLSTILPAHTCPKCGRLVITVEFEIERNEQFQRDWNQYKLRGKKGEE